METPIIPNIVSPKWDAQIQKIAADLEKLAGIAEKVVIRFDSGSIKEATDIMTRHAKLIDDLTKAQKTHNETMREQERLQKQEAATLAQVNAITDGQTKRLSELRLTKRELNKITELQIKLAKSEKGSYNALSAQYELNVIELNKYSQANIKLSPTLNKLQNDTRQMRKEMEAAKIATNDYRLQVGHYANAWQRVGGMMKGAGAGMKSAFSNIAAIATRFLGFTAIIYGVIRAVKGAFNTMADFDQEMANVNAITGATREELAKLRDMAITLGAETKFTATEIAQLETELAKLGFTTPQVIAATKGITLAAAASGEGLSKTAEIVGSVTMAFGMNASETQRVADVMSMSFNKSALDLTSFSESIKHVAPIARQAGASVEEVAAMLSVLSNAGINGSIAGTALRNIFTELASGSGTLTEKMEALAKGGLTVEQAAGLVGKRAQASILILKDSTDEVRNLTQEYIESFGEAEKVAAKQLDTIRGQFTLTKSAWSSLVLSIENGTGWISMWLKQLAKETTDAFNGIRLSMMSDEEREQERIKNIARARMEDFEKTVQTQKDKQKYVDDEIAAETELLKQKNARIREIRTEVDANKSLGGAWEKSNKALIAESWGLNAANKERLAYIQLLKDKKANLNDEALALNKNTDIAENNAKESAAFARERYEAETFYSEQRVKAEEEMLRLQDTINKETVEGVLNSYDEREEAARAYYLKKSELMDIDLQKEQKDIEESTRKSLQQIDNRITALQKRSAKGATPAGGEQGADVASDKEFTIEMASLSKARQTILENEKKRKLEIQSKYKIDLIQNTKSLSATILSIDRDRYDDEVYELKVSNDEKLQLIKEFAEKQRIEAEKLTPMEIVASAFGVERDDDFNALALDHEENQRRLEEQLRFIDEQLAAVQKGTEEEKQLYRDLADAERQIEDEKREYMLASLRMVTEKTKEAYKDMAQSIKQAVSGIVDAYNDTQQERTNKESERLNEERDERLSRLNEEAMTEEAITKEKDRINDSYDKKQEELADRQAERERNAFLLEQGLALAGIWVKYGQAIAAYTLAEAELAAALAVILGPAAPAAAVAAYAPLKTAAAVSAGANSALIVAQTIPSFADGGQMEKTGTALVGDASLFGKPKRRELLLYPTGDLALTPDSPTLMTLPKGTTVYPDADRLPSLRDIEKKIIVNSIFNSKEIVDELRTLVAVTDRKPKLIDLAKQRRLDRQ